MRSSCRKGKQHIEDWRRKLLVFWSQIAAFLNMDTAQEHTSGVKDAKPSSTMLQERHDGSCDCLDCSRKRGRCVGHLSTNPGNAIPITRRFHGSSIKAKREADYDSHAEKRAQLEKFDAGAWLSSKEAARQTYDEGRPLQNR